nr:o-succinylbenzoate--CoA ligase [Salinibacillus xinjiangensis]
MEVIPHWLEKRAYISPNQTAIQLKDKTQISFRQLRQDVKQLAEKLNTLGIQPGVHVSLLANNSYDMVKMIHALTYLQATIVLLNARLTPDELHFQYEDSKSQFLLFQEGLEEKVQTIQARYHNQVVSFQEAFQSEGSSFDVPEEMNLNDIFTIIYTSGTTGFPKGVQLTYGNHFWSATSSALNLGIREEDRWLAMLPLFHVSGLSILVKSLVYGMPVHLHEKFSVNDVHREIMEEGVTIVSVVTVMVEQLLERLQNESYPDSLRCLLLGGGPAPKPLLEKCKDEGIPIFQSYGMTETSSQIVTLSAQDALTKIGSAGKPLFPAQLKIQQESGYDVPNVVGEIVVKGPMVTQGYFEREEANQDTFHDDGWLKTGDLGYIDEQGYLYVVDRRKDLIISGGENVYPAEVESALKGIQGVKDAGVTGIEDHKWGQVPVGFIVRQLDSKLDEAEIMEELQNKLAKYKIPKAIYFVDDLPRNASKKLLRRTLAEWAEERRG